MTPRKSVYIKASNNTEMMESQPQGEVFKNQTKEQMGCKYMGAQLLTGITSALPFANIDFAYGPRLGTSFYLYFAISRESVKEIESESVTGGNEKVLIIDDDPVQNEVASRLLQKLGYRVHTALSGELAVEHLKKHREDILILDMVMSPGINGAETYRQALEINPEQKAIILSGFVENDRVKQAISLGAGAFIRKPLTLKSLAATVRKELNREVRGPSKS
jgi:CheY-like chemotaxis protein